MTPRASAWGAGSSQMRALMVKELRLLVRDRLLFGFVIYIFSLHIVISTLGMSLDLRHSPTIVHDGDRTPASRELAQAFREPQFSVRSAVEAPRREVFALDQGMARVVVDIPAGFARSVGRGTEPSRVQLLVDGSKVTLGFLAASYATRIVRGVSARWSAERLAARGISEGTLPVVRSRTRTWYNFTLDDQRPGALSILLTMMTVACVMLPAAAAVREKERGTIEQLLVSPVTPLQIMLAKTLPMVLVTVIGSACALFAIMRPLFGVPMRGSAVLFLVMVALYAFTNAGLGLALSTVAKSSGQAGLLVILTVMPMLQLSGTYSPVESAPRALRLAMNVSPLHHFVRIAYGIAFRGDGVSELWAPALCMVAIGGVFFSLGLWRFRAQFS